MKTPPFDALRNDEFFAKRQRDDWGHGLDWSGGSTRAQAVYMSLAANKRGYPLRRNSTRGWSVTTSR